VRDRVSALALALALLLTCMAGLTQRADANFIGVFEGLPSIIIQSDGSVVPQTEYVTREGNVYTLTEDLQQTYVIAINCSNITFDGAGHIINGTQPSLEMRKMGAVGYHSNGIYLEKVTNVIINNITILGFTKSSINVYNCSRIDFLRIQSDEIYMQQSTYCTLSESITGAYLGSKARYNTIFKNNLSLLVSGASENLIYENNISVSPYGYSVTTWRSSNSWDNGSVGNYWSDYFDRYPDASEISNSGVADMPYVIAENNVDNYPLMRPVRTGQETEAAPFIVTIVAGVSIVLIAGATAGFVYQKKHGSRRKSDNQIAE
jgi:hypothetical protein